MSRIISTKVCAAIVCAAVGIGAQADPIAITGYDITDAVTSGHGLWAHTYTGTITNGASFNHNGYAGTKATYSGFGSGTMNDGIIGSTVDTSQLFVTPAASDGTPIRPVITFALESTGTLNTIEIYGGDNTGNVIPGQITSVRVKLVGPGGMAEQVFTTEPFGINNGGGVPVNDRITIAGSSLAGFAASQIVLSDFQGTFANWFSIAEVRVDGAAGPALAVSGNCPGTTTLEVSGATPNGTVAFIFAFNTGSAIVPPGTCAGTQLGLDRTAQLINTVRADGSGNAQLVGFAPASVCNGFVQALDVSTCTTTNVAEL